MGRIYFLIFWLPAAASAILTWIAWRTDMLYRPWIPAAVFLLALLLQWRSMLFSLPWLVGFTTQAVLAIYLAIRFKIE